MVTDQGGESHRTDDKGAKPDRNSAEVGEQWDDQSDFEWCRAAYLLDTMEEYRELIGALTTHLAADPECLPAYNNRAVAYDEIGEVEKAEHDFQEAARRVSDDPLPLKNFGLFLVRRRDDVEAAIELYGRALNISPSDAYLHRCMAHALIKRDRHREALTFFTQAIKLDPTFARTYRQRADSFEKLGRRFPAMTDRLVATILEAWRRMGRR